MSSDTHRSHHAFITDILLFICCAALLALLALSWRPNISSVTYRFSDLLPHTSQLPILVNSKEKQKMIVHIPLYLHWFHPTQFVLKPDDCISELRVNGIELPHARFCDYGAGRSIDFRSLVKSGWNSIDLVLTDQGGKVGINVQASRMDIGFLFLLFLGMCLFVWFFLALRDYSPWFFRRSYVFAVMLFGGLLRLLYVLATPLRERSYDIDGHIEYIQYVLAHWKLPLAHSGWELHQPPLYYFFGAGFIHILKKFGQSFQEAIEIFQWSSFFFSILALAGGVWCLYEIFHRKEQRRWVILGGLFLAAYPGLIMLSSRIYNDAMTHMFSFIAVAFLLRWWRKGSMASWYGFLCIATLATLTKLSALPLLATGFLLLLFRKESCRYLVFQGVAALALVTLLLGWYPALRLEEPNTNSSLALGNTAMNGKLKVERNLGSYLTFNPQKIYQIPFNDPWSDDKRRQYFPEYFLKSSLFGEFRFEKLIGISRILLVCIMVLLPFMFLGVIADLRMRLYESAPVLILTLLFSLSAALYPTIFPYAPNQDFRFSSILLLPAAYFLMRGISLLPKYMRVLGFAPLVGFIVFATGFILKIYQTGTPTL